MFDIGFLEILLVGVLALLVLGPERLPGAMRSAAKTFRSIRGMASGFKQEVEEQLRVHELHENLKKAEQQNMKNLSPDLQKAVDELKSAAESVNQPYKKENSDPETDNTILPNDKEKL